MLAAGSATRVSTRGPLEPPLLLRATPATARLPRGGWSGRSFVTLPKLRCTKPAELLVLQRLRACAFGSGPRRCASCGGFAIPPRSGGRATDPDRGRPIERVPRRQHLLSRLSRHGDRALAAHQC